MYICRKMIMNILFYSTYIIWILSEIILNRLARSGKSDKQAADKNTELYVWLSIIISITIGVFVARTTAFPIFFNEQLELIGIIVIIIGIILRIFAIIQL
jgi:hypothetical protein